jgi:hypothetical protein
MALFPVLEIESGVQISDKTRFDASKSFVTKGATAISTMTVKAGADGSAISVYDATVKNRVLDFVFDVFKIDIDATNNKIDFKESAGSLVATLTSGTYTMAQLATEMKTQLDAAGLNTYTVTVSAKNEVTIAADGGFSLYPATGANAAASLLNQIGFKTTYVGISAGSEPSGAATYTGKIVDRLPRAILLTIGDGSTTATKTKYVNVFSVAGDNLFSDDTDLTKHEPDILKWIPDGRSSFMNVHRRSQELILAWLDEKGYTDVYGDKFDKFDLVDIEEVKQWSVFMTLRLIFEGISNAIDDIFAEKAKRYLVLEESARNRAIIRIDTDNEYVGVSDGLVVRR